MTEYIELNSRNDFTLKELQDAVNRKAFLHMAYEENDPYGYVGEGKERRYISRYDYTKPLGLIRSDHYNDKNTFLSDGGILEGIGEFRQIAYDDEGDGSPAYSVLEHKGSGRLFMAQGTYSSWDTSEWYDITDEVVPVEVKVIRYKTNKGDYIYPLPLKEIDNG